MPTPKRITALVTPRQFAQLKALSKESGIKVVELIRRAIDAMLEVRKAA